MQGPEYAPTSAVPLNQDLALRSVSLFSVLKPVPELLDMTILFSELRSLALTGVSTRLLAAAEAGDSILYIPSNVETEVEGSSRGSRTSRLFPSRRFGARGAITTADTFA
jgi:hypothetical protein